MSFRTGCCDVCERSPYCGNECGSCVQEQDPMAKECGALIGPEGESCGVLGPCREHHGAGFCRSDKSGWKCDEHDLLPLYPDGRCKEGKRRIATIAKDWKAEVEDWKAEVEDWKAKRMRAKVDDFFCIGCGKAHGTLPCWIPFRSPDAFWLGAAALNGIIGMGIAIRSRVEMEVWGSFERRARSEALLGSAEKTLTALNKINDIRNSIIGSQTFNWSEHAYPLVAALDEAGFKGMPFPEARENVGRLIERATRAEAEVELLREALRFYAQAPRGKDGAAADNRKKEEA